MGAVPLSDEQRRARARRTRAARKFRPTKIDTLFVAEAPPATVDRYFYFEGVREQDSLFRNVCEGVLRHTPSREGKTEALAELQARGFFLIDLSPDPLDGQSLDALVPGLVRRCTRLDPPDHPDQGERVRPGLSERSGEPGCRSWTSASPSQEADGSGSSWMPSGGRSGRDHVAGGSIRIDDEPRQVRANPSASFVGVSPDVSARASEQDRRVQEGGRRL